MMGVSFIDSKCLSVTGGDIDRELDDEDERFEEQTLDELFFGSQTSL